MLSGTISELRCDDFSTEVWCWQGQSPLHEGRFGVTFDLRVHDCRQSWGRMATLGGPTYFLTCWNLPRGLGS